MQTWEIVYTGNRLICTAETAQDARDENSSWEHFCGRGVFVGVFPA
jgi:hypothetical protein